MDIILDDVGFGFALEFLKQKNDFRYGLRCKEWDNDTVVKINLKNDGSESHFYREFMDKNGNFLSGDFFWFPFENIFESNWQIVYTEKCYKFN